MLAMPDRRTKASAGHRTTQAGTGRLTFHMSVTPGMAVHGTNRTNRTNLMMSDNRMKPRARQTEVSASSATIYTARVAVRGIFIPTFN
jgi:hypothetical protein